MKVVRGESSLLGAGSRGCRGNRCRPPAVALAAGPWYVSGSVGGYFREDATPTTTISNGVIVSPGEVARTFDPGYILNLAVGYRLPARLRAEIELGYADYDADSVTPMAAAPLASNGVTFSRPIGSDLHRYMVTANLFYDLPVEGRFVPYVGGGIGAIHVQAATITYESAAGGRFTSRLAAGDKAVALLEGGVTIAVTDAIAVVPAYRYLRQAGSVGNNGTEVAHVVKLGMRYSF
jgi:opacity protein-like surface antigen